MKTLADGLSRALEDAGDVIVVYSDLVGVPVFAGGRDATVAAHYDAIMDAADGRMVVFPTFNYEWCERGYHDPRNTPSGVGVLSEYARQRAAFVTTTPLFSFAVADWGRVADNGSFPAATPDVLGKASVFGWLVEHGATVLAYGCRLRHASALHYNERVANVPYRWLKAFPGKVEGYGRFTVYYHARPQGTPTVEYDWEMVEAIIRPAFSEYEVGPGRVYVGGAHAVSYLLDTALSIDEHAFLTEPPHDVYARYGKPIRMECAA